MENPQGRELCEEELLYITRSQSVSHIDWYSRCYFEEFNVILIFHINFLPNFPNIFILCWSKG